MERVGWDRLCYKLLPKRLLGKQWCFDYQNPFVGEIIDRRLLLMHNLMETIDDVVWRRRNE
jgi:hypothetical protein